VHLRGLQDRVVVPISYGRFSVPRGP
jgi:hypothetical protein